MTNDPRGTDLRPNIMFNENGNAIATRSVPAANLEDASCLEDLRDSELLTKYGHEFWDVHSTLGQRETPITFEAGCIPALLLRI